jgi:hypothetical protein
MKNDNEALELAVREGRASRRCGLKLSDCPPFKSDDLTASWRIGWRAEDELCGSTSARRTSP